MGPAEVPLALVGIISTVAGASAAGLHLATVDQAEIRGLVTTGHAVRRGAASDFMSSVTLIAGGCLIAWVEDSPCRGPLA